jgi:Zn-dependent protease with chaperone function
MNKLTSQFQKIINNELASHERVLWAGHPVAKRMAMTAFKSWIFFIPWTAATLFMFKEVYDTSKGEFIPQIVIVVFALIGLWMLLAPIRKWFKARKMVYVVTNKRVMTIEAIGQIKIHNFEADKISILEKKIYTDGCGDLILSKETYLHSTRGGNRDRERNRVTQKIRKKGLFAVPNVKLVEDSIRTMLRENAL